MPRPDSYNSLCNGYLQRERDVNGDLELLEYNKLNLIAT